MTGFKTNSAIIPTGLFEPENFPLLTGMMRGLEKECLRVSPSGHIAMTPHPRPLGSALAHPLITTDFSEALLEFITSPSHSISTVIEQLHAIHTFSYQHLGDELLWCSSMPCMVGEPDKIPIAQYGTSNRAKMKSVYRLGLGHRYGRTMQTVAGVHYNFSFPKSFWAYLHHQEAAVDELGTYITKRYFHLIRNFRRNYWLLVYFFGASPAMCRSFVQGRKHTLVPLGDDKHTLHLPYATSLRMGDLGYQSSAQEALQVCYNTRANYVNTLNSAISTEYPPYADIGVTNDAGEFIQLNTSLLQIENEFYGPIRPKRTANNGETALTALCARGVEYVEVRCLDLDPFAPLAVTEQQMRFLDIFLFYCALADSPFSSTDESKLILANQKRVVNEGRRPNLMLKTPEGIDVSLKEWGMALMDALHPIALLLDKAHQDKNYIDAWQAQRAKLDNPELTPSAQVLNELTTKGVTFAQWAQEKAEHNKAYFESQTLGDDLQKRFDDLAEESIYLQTEEESQEQGTFTDYLRDYYKQYSQCCGEYPC